MAAVPQIAVDRYRKLRRATEHLYSLNRACSDDMSMVRDELSKQMMNLQSAAQSVARANTVAVDVDGHGKVWLQFASKTEMHSGVVAREEPQLAGHGAEIKRLKDKIAELSAERSDLSSKAQEVGGLAQECLRELQNRGWKETRL